MARYAHLLEARLILEKGMLRQRMRDVARATGLRFRAVPHFTLAYSFAPRAPAHEIMEAVRDVSSKFGTLDFVINGYEIRKTRHGYAFAFKVEAGDRLVKFRRDMYKKIRGMIDERDDAREFNSQKDFWFHVSIGIRLDGTDAYRLGEAAGIDTVSFGSLEGTGNGRAGSIHPITFPSEISRITLLRDGRIGLEYDRLTDRILGRRDALSRRARYRTLQAFRSRHGLEKAEREDAEPGQTWVISDTHFDHENIISYTGRPFSDAEEMNGILVSNWNRTVHPGDRVYFLGDMAFGRGSRPKEYWLGRLNGDITYVRGNHDTVRGTVSHAAITHGGRDLLLVHDPDDLPLEWDGWVIHGDKHNNQLGEYPLVNTKKRTMNVCSELIKYSPLSMDTVVRLIGEGRDRMVL